MGSNMGLLLLLLLLMVIVSLSVSACSTMRVSGCVIRAHLYLDPYQSPATNFNFYVEVVTVLSVCAA